jgi:hypothetical protein
LGILAQIADRDAIRKAQGSFVPCAVGVLGIVTARK